MVPSVGDSSGTFPIHVKDKRVQSERTVFPVLSKWRCIGYVSINTAGTDGGNAQADAFTSGMISLALSNSNLKYEKSH